MRGVSQDFIEYVHELLAPLGVIRVKRMFGAAGVYLDEVFFAVLDDDQLYFRVDEEIEDRFRAAGSEPFIFRMNDGREAPLNFWRAPDAAMDGPDEAAPWARMAFEAALRKKAAKGRRKKKA
jgi:DNA transformation protein